MSPFRTAAPACPSAPERRVAPALRQRLTGRFGNARGTHEDGGFTLIEAVVSSTIFVIVAAAASLAIVTGITANNASSDRVGAALVAQQESDRARAMSRDLLTATPVATSTATRGSKQYTVQRTVSYLPAGNTACPTSVPTGSATTVAREIRVNVVVTVPGSGRTVAMDTVLAC